MSPAEQEKALLSLAEEIHRTPLPLDPEELVGRLEKLGLRLDAEGAMQWYPRLLKLMRMERGPYVVPQVLVTVCGELLKGRTAKLILDPFAGAGALLGGVTSAMPGIRAVAFSTLRSEFALGSALLPDVKWINADPLKALTMLNEQPDVVLSIPPFGMRMLEPIELHTPDRIPLEVKGDHGNAIMAAVLQQMAPEGVGLFVAPPSFLFATNSVYHLFPKLGLALEAAFAMPSGSFAPYTNISSYLFVVRKGVVERLFTAQLSSDQRTNEQIVSNFKNGREADSIEMGCFADPKTYRGIDALLSAQRMEDIEQRFGALPIAFEELSTAINLGRSKPEFSFPDLSNAVYIPMIGSSDVVDSVDDFKLKPQNYAQVAIDPSRSKAAFVARFLNSEFGKEIRQRSMGGFIPKLNKRTLQQMEVFVPSMATQQALLELEGRITSEQNTLLGLQNELNAMRREAWSDPRTIAQVDERLRSLADRMAGGLKQRAEQGLEIWFDTLPFPLASILRAWQATPTQDHRMKHEHLLHFFEATAEFLSVVLLSAYSSNPSFFQAHKLKLSSGLDKQHLSFERATFGTWKTVIDYLGRQTKLLLQDSGKKPEDAQNDRATCAELFADHTLGLPAILAKPELAAIIATTNKLRNDWKGHGGVLGNEEAALRNESLIAELQKLREVMEDVWAHVQLVHALHCRPKQGIFENEVAMLMGSNSEFLKETRTMATWLDVERLYLARKGSASALKLLPLIQVSASPSSAKNACYFFNRLDKTGSRFVSYHYVDKPEMVGSFVDAEATIKLLTEA